MIVDLARVTRITHSQAFDIVKHHSDFNKPLKPHQVFNVMVKAWNNTQKEIAATGGDFHAILTTLAEKAQTEGWKFEVQMDESNTITAIWWQSGMQNELSRCYHNILLNDNTYNQNNCRYILNIGIIIDSSGMSHNSFYALHA